MERMRSECGSLQSKEVHYISHVKHLISVQNPVLFRKMRQILDSWRSYVIAAHIIEDRIPNNLRRKLLRKVFLEWHEVRATKLRLDLIQFARFVNMSDSELAENSENIISEIIDLNQRVVRTEQRRGVASSQSAAKAQPKLPKKKKNAGL